MMICRPSKASRNLRSRHDFNIKRGDMTWAWWSCIAGVPDLKRFAWHHVALFAYLDVVQHNQFLGRNGQGPHSSFCSLDTLNTRALKRSTMQCKPRLDDWSFETMPHPSPHRHHSYPHPPILLHLRHADSNFLPQAPYSR